MSEMVITSIMQILDVGGNVKRHVLAPRAKNQRASDKMFEGTQTELAERYTVSSFRVEVLMCRIPNRNDYVLTHCDP